MSHKDFSVPHGWLLVLPFNKVSYWLAQKEGSECMNEEE